MSLEFALDPKYETFAEYLAARKAEKEQVAEEVKAKLHGVRVIDVAYSGEGDSGQIDDVLLLLVEDFNENEDEEEAIITYAGRRQGVEIKDKELREKIEQYCYDVLEEKAGGWENNDGASGNFLINLETGTVKWEHTTYRKESDTEYETL